MDYIDVFLARTLKDNSNRAEAGAPYEKSILAIVCGAKSGTAGSLSSLKKLQEGGFSITILPTEKGHAMWGNYIERYLAEMDYLRPPMEVHGEQLFEHHHAMVIAGLTAGTLGKIAGGIFDNLPLYMVYQFLMGQRKVLASKDALIKHIDGSSPAKMNKALESLMEKNIKLAADMGICFVDPINLPGHFQAAEDGGSEIAEYTGGSRILSGKLISESALSGVGDGGRVTIHKDAVVTPSAKDVIHSRNISLIYR